MSSTTTTWRPWRGCSRSFTIRTTPLSGSAEYREIDMKSTSVSIGSRRTRSARKITEPFSTERSEEHTSELQSRQYLVCRLLLEKKKKKKTKNNKKHTQKK